MLKKILFNHAIKLIAFCVILASCKPETGVTTINLNELETDTTGWDNYCIGYHSLMIPPGLSPHPQPASNIDWHYPLVEHDYTGSAREYIENHPRFGGAVFQTRVNGWEFVVARERRSRRISTRSLVFYGARKFGDDIVMFTEDASISIVGDGTDPKYRAFYSTLSAEPVTQQNRSQGFCYDGYVFSGYRPEHVYDFSASFGGIPTRGSNGFSADRHGYRIRLSQEMVRPPEDKRPLIPQPTLDDFPHILDVEHMRIRKNGFNGLLTQISVVGDKAGRYAFKAFIEGPYGDLQNPVYAVETYDNIHPMSFVDGREEFLGFLANITAN